jgi:hypothetical protein
MAAPIASMSTAAAPSPYLNGTSAVSAEVLREADFLQQILKIRDDVLASKHPRIQLPPKVIEQVAPRLPQTAPSRPTTNGTPNGTSSQLFPPRPASSARPPTSPFPPTQRPYSAKSSSSSIDPILLTKSEHLVKAEQQLKRQQIERALKDQFDKKGRGNDADERESHIDVEQCLIKAHQLVPPVSGLRSTTNNSDGADAESFDENSYYSSKADSWSSEDVDAAHNANADAAVPLTSQAKQTAKPVTIAGLHTRQAEPTVIDLDEEAYEPADDIEIYEPEPVSVEDVEEEAYSPPPADIVPSEPLRGRARDRHGGTNGYDIIFLSFPGIPRFNHLTALGQVIPHQGLLSSCPPSANFLWDMISLVLDYRGCDCGPPLYASFFLSNTLDINILIQPQVTPSKPRRPCRARSEPSQAKTRGEARSRREEASATTVQAYHWLT